MPENRRHTGLVAIALIVTANLAQGATADPGFARVDDGDDGGPRALQVAVAHYAPEDPTRSVSVDLVSAIHIGDASYYAELNERFAAYDVLLYELVAPQGVVVEKDSEKTGFVSNAQQLLTRALALSFQLDEIDYTQPNLVHADLSGAELRQSMAERDESLYTYLWRVFYAAIREYAKDPLGMRDMQMVASSVSVDGTPSFKAMLAFEIARNQSLEEVFGEDADSAIIGARNERAIEVMRAELDDGARHVGIFYGVGHMPDFEDKLIAMGYTRTGTTWIDAWQLAED